MLLNRAVLWLTAAALSAGVAHQAVRRWRKRAEAQGEVDAARQAVERGELRRWREKRRRRQAWWRRKRRENNRG